MSECLCVCVGVLDIGYLLAVSFWRTRHPPAVKLTCHPGVCFSFFSVAPPGIEIRHVMNTRDIGDLLAGSLMRK
jgi:hypothetical protein